jgi:predicted transcriptional regulator
LERLLLLAPCEIAVKSVIPAIRAYIAKQLVQTYKMKQTDVAGLLGITQTAVSKYVGNVRGQAVGIDQESEVERMMNEIASRLADKKTSGSQLTLEFCAVCRAVRRNGQMCELCERSDPKLRSVSCKACM